MISAVGTSRRRATMPSPDDQPDFQPNDHSRVATTSPFVDRGAHWSLPLAVAITLGVQRDRLLTLFEGVTELRHFFDRAIGVTTLEGVDASGYAHNFVALQLLLALTFLVAFAALQFLRSRLDAWTSPAEPDQREPEHLWIARLAEIWAAVAFFDVFFRSPHLRALAVVLGHMVAFAFALLVARTWLRRRSIGRRSLFAVDRHFVLATLLWPSSFLLAAWAAIAAATGERVLRVPSTTLGFAVYCLAWLALLWAAGRLADSAPARRRLTAALVPWMLVPLAMVGGNEMHALRRAVTPQTWALILVASLAAASAAAWLLLPRWLRRGRELPSCRWLLHAVYFPLAVVSLALLRYYGTSRDFGTLDYFHLGEMTVPTHQLFRFGALPLLDLRPAHTLSDLFWQSLYVLFHGYDPAAPVDMALWNQILPYAVTLLLSYYVLSRLISPGYALLATCLLPVLVALPTYYAAVLVPALFLARAVERPTTRRFVALWLSLAFLALWRIDFGLLGAVALAGVLTPYLLDPHSLVRRLRGQSLRGRHRLVAAGRSLAWAAGGGLLAILGLLAVRGPAALDRLSFLLGSYSYRLITRTRSEVIRDFDLAAVLQYYLLPWVALVFVLAYGVRWLVQRRHVPGRVAMLIFLATFSLVISVRSMERHSLIESFNPYLAVFLLAVLPALFVPSGRPRESQTTRAVFAAVLVLFSLAALPPAAQTQASPGKTSALLGPSIFAFESLSPGQPRVRFRDAKHRRLVSFLGDRLAPGETFYDFTNSPLLYVLADRRFPTYVIPNLIQTSETVQADVLGQLDALHAEGRLPLVVFEQGNPFWDNTDGVANEVRSYRIAEWIYRHYRPAFQVGSYQVWQDRRAPAAPPDAPSDLPADATADAGEVVYELAVRDEPTLWNLRHGIDESSFEAIGDDPNVFRLFDLSSLPDLDSESSWQLELQPTWTGDEPLQVFFAFDGGHFQAAHTAWIAPEDSGGPVSLLIQPPRGARRWTDVRLDVPDGATLTLGKARLRISGGVSPLTPEDLHQSFDLGRLPAVWARFDPLQARSETPVLAQLVERPLRLAAGDDLALEVPRPLAADEVDGAGAEFAAYLHLRIASVLPLTSADEATLEIRYGADEPEAFSFELAPARGVSTPLARNSSEALHDLETFPELPRWVYRSAGPEPEIVRPFALNSLPEIGPGEELRLRLHYRSRAAGRLLVCLDCDSLPADQRSVSAPFVRTSDSGDPAVVELPLHAAADADSPALRLGLRFAGLDRRGEPPMFEIVEADLIRSSPGSLEYLIRLSTQWRWATGDVDRLILRSPDRPVVVEGAWLRAGD